VLGGHVGLVLSNAIEQTLEVVKTAKQLTSSIMVQLTGLGGVGKRLLAIEYVRRFGAPDPGGIYWLRANWFELQKPVDSEAQARPGDVIREKRDLLNVTSRRKWAPRLLDWV
jgi:hypothetical protein